MRELSLEANIYFLIWYGNEELLRRPFHLGRRDGTRLLVEFENGWSQRERGLAGGHAGEALAFFSEVGFEILFETFFQLGFVVEGI